MEIEVSEVPCNMIYAGISCYKRIIWIASSFEMTAGV
jgi:hypothetical protein